MPETGPVGASTLRGDGDLSVCVRSGMPGPHRWEVHVLRGLTPMDTVVRSFFPFAGDSSMGYVFDRLAVNAGMITVSCLLDVTRPRKAHEPSTRIRARMMVERGTPCVDNLTIEFAFIRRHG